MAQQLSACCVNKNFNKKTLVEEIAKLPVAFAQVREDSALDLDLIKNHFPSGNARILMVASGGCTASLLASSSLVSHLHIVDPNASELYLTRLKLYLLHFPPNFRLQILGHSEMPVAERKEALIKILKELSIPQDAFGDLGFVAMNGVDHIGRYEQLFSELRKQLLPFEDEIKELFVLQDVEQQATRVQQHTALGKAIDAAFHEVMALDNLVKIFGKEATSNPRQTFADHFIDRTRHMLSTQPAWSSPYLAQLLLGHFTHGVVYPWLTGFAPKKAPEIIFSQNTMQEILRKVEPESFDVIHLSNILDWLTEEDAQNVLSLARNALKDSGKIIIRQLNSSLTIPQLGKGYEWLDTEAKVFHQRDRSFFYSNLYIAEKEEEVFAAEVTKVADEILSRVGIMKNPYFEELKTGKLTLDSFRKTQEQFYFAVAYFSRPMAALISRMNDPFQRLDILHNIVEEHGDFSPEKFHKTTFEQFLTSLGSNKEKIAKTKISAEVMAFNSSLMGVCLGEDPLMGIGCNGIIEYAFATISATIGQAVVKNDWVKQENLVHYSLHAELDIRHSQEFFVLLEPHMKDPSKRREVEAGLELGAYIFNNLYKNLHKMCSR
jgi:S-adenosylmethionine-diacylglycerol 3-amino-3-carboxypropyl transferase